MIQISEQVLSDAKNHKDIGNEYFKNKEYQKAIEEYSKAIDLNPNDGVFYSNRAACYLALKEYQKTIDDCDRAMRFDESSKILRRKAIANQNLGKFDEAVNIFKQALQYTPEDGALSQEYTTAQQLQNSYREAQKSIDNNDYQAAIYQIQQVIGRCDAYKPQLLFIEALAKVGENEKASKYLMLMQSQYGTTPDVYYLKGLIEMYNGNSERAKSVLIDAMRIDPDNTKCRDLLKRAKLSEQLKQKGNQLLQELKLNDAVECYTEALQADPYNRKMNAIIYANRGLVHQKMSQQENAINDFNQSIQLNPSYAKAYLRRADSYDKLGQFDEAENDFIKAIQIDPSFEQEYGKKIQEMKRKSKLAKKKDYYKILEVTNQATDAELKKSYRRLALLYHPDKQKDKDEETKKIADQKFRDVADAYSILSDKKKRDLVDQGIDPNDQGQGEHADASQVFQMFFGGGGGFQQFGGFPGGGFPGGQNVRFEFR